MQGKTDPIKVLEKLEAFMQNLNDPNFELSQGLDMLEEAKSMYFSFLKSYADKELKVSKLDWKNNAAQIQNFDWQSLYEKNKQENK